MDSSSTPSSNWCSIIPILGDEVILKFGALQPPDFLHSPGLSFDMMAKDNHATDRVEASVDKAPLRTYSRRGHLTKRSYSSLPKDLPDSLINSDSNGARLRGAQLGRPERRRRRNTTSSVKTLTEVFWEQLSSSAPIYSRQPETDQSELEICTSREDNAAVIEKPTHSVENDDYLPANHDDQNPSPSLNQRAHNASFDPMIPHIFKQNSMGSEKLDNDEDHPQPRLPNKQGLVRITVSRSKLRKPLSLFSSRSLETKRARRTLDVDESLSVVEASPAKGAPINNVPTAWRKNNDLQSFRRLESPKEAKIKHSSDGFEREEARTGSLGRRRRMNSIDHNIGPLELTQNRAPAQKLEGPTWGRVQKKSQVPTVTKPRNKTQHLAKSIFQIDFEEDVEPGQSRQSDSNDQAPRGLCKRHTSQLISDDDDDDDDYDDGDDEDEDELIHLAVPSPATERDSTPPGAGIGTVRTSLAKHDKKFPHISDADEPVVLLATSGHNEDKVTYISDGDEPVILLIPRGESKDGAALATIPRTDTPEHGENIEEAVGQLPPKEWMLNALDYDRDALALRPDSREWTREVEIPDKYARK